MLSINHTVSKLIVINQFLKKKKKKSRSIHAFINIEEEEKKENIPFRREKTINSRFLIANPVSIRQGDQVDASRKTIILSIEGRKKPWILLSLGKRFFFTG